MDDGLYWNGKYVEDEPIGRKNPREFCICSVQFQMPKKDLSKDTSQ